MSKKTQAEKGPPTRLKPAERIMIEVMDGKGKSGEAIARALNRDGRTIRNYIKEAREVLTSKADTYVNLHEAATRIAALKGDAGPSQWMMERTGVVKPATKSPESNGFTVKIGVLLPGLGDTAKLGMKADVAAIEAAAIEETDEG